jgi:translocation and assembly module TamB
MKKLFKYTGYTVLALLVLLVVGMAFTQTGWFKGWLRETIEESANGALTAELRIGSLEGTLWGTVQLGDILLQSDADTLLILPRLSAEYDLLPLLQGTLVVRSLHLTRPDIRLHQQLDSSWDFQSLVPPETSERAEGATTGRPFDWRIHLRDARIDRGRFRLFPLHSIASLPHTVDEVTLHCSGSYAPEISTLAVDSLAFQTNDPALALEEIAARLRYTGDTLILDRMRLKSRHNSLQASGLYVIGSRPSGQLSLSSSPLHISEFAPFLPGVGFTAAPTITGEAQYENDTVFVRCTLQDGEQIINTRGLLDAGGERKRVSLVTTFQNIDLARWLSKETPSTDLTGNCTIRTYGLDLETASGGTSITLTRSHVLDWQIEDAALEILHDAGDLKGSVTVTGRFGEMNLKANLHDILEEQKFSIALQTRNLDLATLLMKEDLSSDINSTLYTEGAGFDPGSITALFSLTLDTSSFSGLTLSSVRATGAIDGEVIALDTFTVHDQMLDLHASGSLGTNDGSSFRFAARIRDLAPLATLLSIDSLQARGNLEGTIAGTADSAAVAMTVDLNNLRAFDGGADSLSGEIELVLGGEEFSLSGQAQALRPRYSSILIDSIAASVRYENDSLFSEIHYRAPHNLSGSIQGIAYIDPVITIALPALQAVQSDTTVASLKDTALVRITEDHVEIASFDLLGEGYRLHAEGNISFAGESKFDFQIQNGNLERILGLVGSSIHTSGTLDADLSLRGSLAAPRLSCTLSLAEAFSGSYHLGDLWADLLYADSSLSWNTSLHQPDGNRITSSGILPLIPSADAGTLRTPGNKPLRFQLAIDGFDISTLTPLVHAADHLHGILRADILVENTLEQPRFNGFITLDSAALQSTSLGLSYDEIGARILGEKEKLLLDDFHIRSGGGTLKASGYISRLGEFLERSTRHAELTMQAKKFVLAQGRNLQMTIDGDLGLAAAGDSASLSGAVTIVRSNIWLPAFFEQMRNRPSEEELPLLVKATRKTDVVRLPPADSLARPGPKLVKNLNGVVKIDIPRNTWFRSPDINVEIEGKLDVVVGGDSLQLFGFVKVFRGTFLVYGKRFEVVEGRLDFQGGPSLIPSISMEVVYKFRRSGGQQEELLMNLRGNALSPEYRFTLNNERVDDRNAMSYILFGRSLDELSQDQRSSISQSTGDLAAGIAASFVAAQLSSTVGQSLGLDVIELTVKDSWQSTSFTVGKYLSDRLYARYTRKLESTSSNETETNEVALAYRFLPFLSVQVTQGTTKSTGYDLIFRFD